MKCIKAIKSSKYSDVGEIKRVSNAEAEEKVQTGYWVYVPKSEYKQAPTPKTIVEDTNEVEEVVEKPKKSKQVKEKSTTESDTKKTRTKKK